MEQNSRDTLQVVPLEIILWECIKKQKLFIIWIGTLESFNLGISRALGMVALFAKTKDGLNRLGWTEPKAREAETGEGADLKELIGWLTDKN